MHDQAGISAPFETFAHLRWNDFEGGFWSLELDPEHAELGAHVVPDGFTPPPGSGDGTRIRARLRAREDAVGFQMAGPHVQVLHAELAP